MLSSKSSYTNCCMDMPAVLMLLLMLLLQYLLKYFVDTNEAEMVELKTRRLFLKRSPCPSHLTVRDFAIGSKVTNKQTKSLVCTNYAGIKDGRRHCK